MREFLIFRLYGPMAAWGDVAVGEYRPSQPHPTKSAILGLLAAALGLSRNDEAGHQALTDGYDFAVRVDAQGSLLRDYHTAQAPTSGSGRNRRLFTNRKQELEVAGPDQVNTILSSRDYRCDGVYTVCLSPREGQPQPYTLAMLQAHLHKPVFPLYLGRKSCPLALPVAASIVSARNLKEALEQWRDPSSEELAPLLSRGPVSIHWEGEGSSGFDAMHQIVRHDRLHSRQRWQFGPRTEYRSQISPKEERIDE